MIKELKQLSGKRLLRFILIRVWMFCFILVLFLLVYSVGTGVLRLLIVLLIPTLWLLAIFLLWGRRIFVIPISLVGVILICFSVLPGRIIDPAYLRTEYIKQLQRYNGVQYVWGGENLFGIDCSGLVRGALINGYVWIGITNLNSNAIRSAFELWWYDCSARALRDKYRGFTEPVFKADSINSIKSAQLQTGDLAVTTCGVHILAYLGDDEWIQADPDNMKVIILKASDDNSWFQNPVWILRWRQMQEGYSK